jgi:Raf kinase inhibitor-like YbhB/YbcL family protein
MMSGQVIAGRYRRLSVLGRGGMAAAWRGMGERLGSPVAVKRLHVLVVAALLMSGCGGREPEVKVSPAPMTIRLTSTAFADQGDIPRRYTCDGENLSPPLRFGAVPSGTAELALLVDDPDAPARTFVHWVGWGIDPRTAALAEGEAAPSEGTNGFGKRGYGGPCPPKGKPHRYVFTVYALSRGLDLPQGASADDLKRAVSGRVLAAGRLVGRYARA